MSTRRKAILMIVTILLLCAVCAAPWAYWAYRDNQAYQADVDRLYEVAGKLGYSKENHIRFYHFKTTGIDWSADLITLVFYSTDSFEQFSEKVDKLQLIEKFYTKNTYSTRADFLELIANYNFPDKLLTLNNYYLHKDFDPTDRPPPNVADWTLKDSQWHQRKLDIYFAQKSKESDVWLLDDQQIFGSIVVVQLNRMSGVR